MKIVLDLDLNNLTEAVIQLGGLSFDIKLEKLFRERISLPSLTPEASCSYSQIKGEFSIDSLYINTIEESPFDMVVTFQDSIIKLYNCYVFKSVDRLSFPSPRPNPLVTFVSDSAKKLEEVSDDNLKISKKKRTRAQLVLNAARKRHS